MADGDLKLGFSESRYSLPNFGVFESLFCCCDEAPWPETTKGGQVDVDFQFQGERSTAAGSRSMTLHGHIFNHHNKQREWTESGARLENLRATLEACL